jgi:GNAT superfamily N-acetyltransferase
MRVSGRTALHRYDRGVATSQIEAVIREAASSDVEAIAALHLASWWAAYKGIVPDQFLEGITLESRVERWRRALSPSEPPLIETMVALHGGTIKGVCSFGAQRESSAPGVGEVYALHVAPDSRRRGLGKLLLDDAVRRMQARGFDAAVLWVLRDNANARRFYEAQGWSVNGEELIEERDGYAIPETRYTITFPGPR